MESTAVVISILLAFAIDAWWEDRSDRHAEIALLARLQADFTAFRPELASVTKEHRARRDACIELLERLSVGDRVSTTPEMDRLIAFAFVGARTFQPGAGAVEAFINGDGVRLVKNKRIIDLLLTWPGLIEELREEERQLQKGSAERWLPYLSSLTNIGPYIAAFQTEIPEIALLPQSQLAPSSRATLLVDEMLLNHILDRFQFQTLAIRDIEPLHKAVDEVLSLIEEEIGPAH